MHKMKMKDKRINFIVVFSPSLVDSQQGVTYTQIIIAENEKTARHIFSNMFPECIVISVKPEKEE